MPLRSQSNDSSTYMTTGSVCPRHMAIASSNVGNARQCAADGSGGRRAIRRSPLWSCTRIRVSLAVTVIVTVISNIAFLVADTRRDAHARTFGQLGGRCIHHARLVDERRLLSHVRLPSLRSPSPISISMVSQALGAAL